MNTAGMLGGQRRLSITPIRLQFESDPDLPPLNEAWLADAELVRVEAVDAGTLKKPLHVNDFALNPEKDEKARKNK